MRTDVNTFLGSYPFRDIGKWDAHELLGEMDRCGITEAWVSNLAGIFQPEPMAGNATLYDGIRSELRLKPIPAIHPGMHGWDDAMEEAALAHAPAVRCDPTFYGLDPSVPEMRSLLASCATHALPLMLAVRLEDIRQRDPADTAPDLAPWIVRQLIRSHPHVRLIVTHADRDFIEQVHFGSTPEEAARILWDICWIWGPPEDHLATLLRTVGIERFTFGTGMPLRLPETSVVRLDLLDLAPDMRAKIEESNLRAFS